MQEPVKGHGFSRVASPHCEAGFSPGPPWLKPFGVPIYFAGLKPGASTAVEDISYAVIRSRPFRPASSGTTGGGVRPRNLKLET